MVKKIKFSNYFDNYYAYVEFLRFLRTQQQIYFKERRKFRICHTLFATINSS